MPAPGNPTSSNAHLPHLVAQDVLSGQAWRVSFEAERATLAAEGSIPHGSVYLCPGWTDIQVNGFGGFDMNADRLQPQAVGDMVRRLYAEGVTAVYPTVVTASAEHMARCLRLIARACESDPDAGASIPGLHLEGPYLSPLDGVRGVHPAAHIHPPDWEEFCRLQEAAGGRIRLVTLAPEQPGSADFIRRLAQAGIVVAIGHSLASTDQLAAAVDAGASLSTHLGNGIALHLRRHPNPIWDQLADDRLWASVIFDGFHLPPSVMRVFLRAKGVGRSVLVSDAVALARMPPGVYDTPVGGRVELHPSGLLNQYGTDYLAGSASSLKDGVQNAVRLAGSSLAEAVQMAALNPAQAMRQAPQDAWVIFHFDPDRSALDLLATLVAGRIVHRSPRLDSYLSKEAP